MRKILCLLAIGLSGCASVSDYQRECDSLHESFEPYLQCVNSKLDENFKSSIPANKSSVQSYRMTGKLLSEKVSNGEITNTEAKYLLEQHRKQLHDDENARLGQAALYSPNTNIVYGTKPNTDMACNVLNGAKIFAQDSSKTYLGEIANSYKSESIFNEFGSYGSEYSSKSIWNEYSTFGSKYSSYSAFNDIAASPPMIIKNSRVVGYLSTNDVKANPVSPKLLRALCEDFY